MKRFGFFKKLGPGLISGASDDDPSGILTYIQGGVMLGFNALWTSLFTLPMMYFIQEMSGRIGLAANKGLIQIIKENYPRWLLVFVVFVSTLVITINIGADLLAIGISVNGILPVGNTAVTLAAAALILFCTIKFSYKKIASIFKWLTLSLLFYVLAVIFLKINWLDALKSTLIPNMSFSEGNLLILVAIFGTTISPYLFFWQADEEIEDKEELEKDSSISERSATKKEMLNIKRDTFAGMLFSNVISWFIIAAAANLAATSGIKSISDFSEAALVFRPMLGDFAYFAFVLGILGTGLLAIPVLAASIGYMFAEAFGWKKGMNKRFREASGFYVVIIIAVAAGLLIDFLGLDPIKLLVYTALFYALITPPIIYIILKVANNGRIMGKWVNPAVSNIFGWLTFAVSAFLAAAYLVTVFF